MKEVVKEAGLRSDGELVQGGADSFVFAPVREDAVGLLLPAVQIATEVSVIDQSDRNGTADAHGDWIEILTMSPPPPTRATQSGGDDDDDDGLPPTLDWGIDGDGPGDQGHGGWCDILSTGGGRAVAEEDDDGLTPTLVWDLG